MFDHHTADHEGPSTPMFAKAAVTALAATFALAAPVLTTPAAASDIVEDVVGQNSVYVTRYEDTILQVARDLGMGFVELLAANPGIDPWLPGEGREVLVPGAHVLPDAPRKGIVVNLAELRLYHFRKDGSVETFPVGIGRDYWETPAFTSRITRLRKDPVWRPPASIRAEKPELPAVVPAGPDNPLGAYALSLAHGAYVIHGTNKPLGVGRRVSHGCIRMYPEDIEAMFPEMTSGLPVRIVNQEIKIGWSGDDLFLEAHPSQQQADLIEAGEILEHFVNMPEMMIQLAEFPGAEEADLDWPLIEQTLRERNGVAVRIGSRSSI
jgi:L,D-transpeptidase ErfK/SrfK